MPKKVSWTDRAKTIPAGGLTTAFFASPNGINSINNTLYGTDPKIKNKSNFDPYQQAIHGQQGDALQGQGGYQSLIDQLRGMLDPNSDYHKAFEEQQIGQFNEQTLPKIGERFAGGYGANSGALSSSGFGQAVGGAAAGLQRDLAVNKTNTIQGALEKLMNQYNSYQDRTTFDRQEIPGQEGLVQKMLPILMKLLSNGAAGAGANYGTF